MFTDSYRLHGCRHFRHMQVNAITSKAASALPTHRKCDSLARGDAPRRKASQAEPTALSKLRHKEALNLNYAAVRILQLVLLPNTATLLAVAALSDVSNLYADLSQLRVHPKTTRMVKVQLQEFSV